MKKRFGEVLLDKGLITSEQLADALALQRRKGMRLGAALVERGHLSEAQLVAALGTLLGIKVVDLSTQVIVPEAVRMVSHAFASEHDLFAFGIRTVRGRKILTVAMSDPLNYRITDELSFMTNAQIEAVLARGTDIDRAIRENYAEAFKSYRDLGKAGLRLGPEKGETTMTIMRRGGSTETVETDTGKVVSPFIAKGGTLDNPEVQLPPEIRKAQQEVSAVLLTEEVSGSTPVDPVSILAVPGRPAHLTIVEADPIPLTEIKKPKPDAPQQEEAVMAPATSEFDEALGALIDAAGGAVNAEAFYGLERKFWALMRILAKKGILNNEDFLAELGEEDYWYGGSS